MHASGSDALQIDGPARYGTDSTGERVLVLPARCRAGHHLLGAVGYQAIVCDGELHVRCCACGGSDSELHWRLATDGNVPRRAELA